MWPFSTPSIDDLQSKAYVIYHELGKRRQIPREERLRQKFPNVDRTSIKIWLDQFKAVDKEIGIFVGNSANLDYRGLERHLKNKFPFMNKKALRKAESQAWLVFR